MSKLSFAKFEGAGNDFILIDDRAPHFPTENKELIRRLCDRKFGVGADGVILLQLCSQADFRMRIFNSDGSEPESCGNGLRCLMRFIADLGLPRNPYRIATGGGIVEADFEGEKISIHMGPLRDLKLRQLIGNWEVHSVDTGVPHAVVFVSDVERIDLMKEAPILRHHPLFQPRGTNVDFASMQPDGSIRVRTFERGLEGESLACGTGATAVAAIAAQIYDLASPVRTLFPGGQIEIRFRERGLSDLRMVGASRLVFKGDVSPP